MQRHEFRLFADYSQFYLRDEGADGDLSESWTDGAAARLLALAPGAVGVGTVRADWVDAAVEVHEAEPPVELAAWDHVVECGLGVPTGRVVVAGGTDYSPDAARVEVPPGHYRARSCAGGLRVAETGGAGDRYEVQLWPGEGEGVRVLKSYGGAEPAAVGRPDA